MIAGELGDLTKAAGLRHRFGAIFGSCRMHAYTLQIAATLPAPALAHGFPEFGLFLNDPFEGLRFERGAVHLPMQAAPAQPPLEAAPPSC